MLLEVIFNSLYTYGAGTTINNYYGWHSNGESGMSSAYKLYVYYTICSKTGVNCAIPYSNNIGNTISNYTNLGDGTSKQDDVLDILKYISYELKSGTFLK